MHGNNKDAREIGEALDAGVGTIIVDNLDEIALLDREAAARGTRQRVLIRVTPGVKPSTHSYISTGQLDSKFGFSIEGGPAAEAVAAVRGAALPRPRGAALPHRVAAVRPVRLRGGRGDRGRLRRARRRRRPAASWTWAAASGSPTPAATTPPPSRTTPRPWSWPSRTSGGGSGLPMPRIMVEPGRSIVGRAGVTVYRVGSTKVGPGRADVRRGGRRHERPAAADALRRRLRADPGEPRRRGAQPDAAPGGQALRERRRAGGRGVACRPSAPATWSACRRPAPTVSRWPPTTTA